MPPEISNNDDESSPLSSLVESPSMSEQEDDLMKSTQASALISPKPQSSPKPPNSPTPPKSPKSLKSPKSPPWVPRDASPSIMAQIHALEKKENEETITVKTTGTRRRLSSAGGSANPTSGTAVSTGRTRKVTPSTSESSAPGPPSKPKPRVLSGAAKASVAKKKRAEAMKWESPYVVTDEKSPLGDANLRNILLMPRAWDVLTAEEKQGIIAKMPDTTHVLGAGTPEARPDEAWLRNDNNFRHDCTRYTENIRLGKHDEQWLREAWAAREKRRRGGFDAFEVQKFERDWGVRLPPPPESEKPAEQQQPPRANTKIRISCPQRRSVLDPAGGNADEGVTDNLDADPGAPSGAASGPGSGHVTNGKPAAAKIDACAGSGADFVGGQGPSGIDTTSFRLKRRSDDEDEDSHDAGRPACVAKRRRTQEPKGHAAQEQVPKGKPGKSMAEGNSVPDKPGISHTETKAAELSAKPEGVVEARSLRVDGPSRQPARAEDDGVPEDTATEVEEATCVAVNGATKATSQDATRTQPCAEEAHQQAGLSEAAAG